MELTLVFYIMGIAIGICARPMYRFIKSSMED